MDTHAQKESAAAGFKADTYTMEQMRQKLVEVSAYFQAEVDRMSGFGTSLGTTFYGGHQGETGQFQQAYQSFGHEWNTQFGRMLALDQTFVNLINEHAEAVRQAIRLYDDADNAARERLEAILDKMK
ncbi:hypothetical protein ACIOD2_41035 [Amycolatopsis sp. NPDC088138]|uniref:hypothetical protein n=1 Tax=Amycolatopsis sp. NPDC088138 TaxID=3363938 RepID=UPI00381A862F